MGQGASRRAGVGRVRKPTFSASCVFDRLSASGGQANDGALVPAGPSLCPIRKREAKERDLCGSPLLCPSKTAIRGPIHHSSFADDPSGLRICKADTQEVGELRTGTVAGEGAVDPVIPAIGRLENGAGISNGPSGRRVREIHIEQRDSPLRFLRSPGAPAIVRHQDGSNGADRRPMLRSQKLNGVEGCARFARLINPMRPAVRRMKNGSAATHHPPLAGRHEREAVERHLAIDEL